MAGTGCGAPLEEYTILLLRTQMWIASCMSPLAWLAWIVSGIGVIRDLEEPDRAMVEMRVAARHSGTLGTARDEDLQEICHLSNVTAEARKLKKPS
jgi:hypothetical protein